MNQVHKENLTHVENAVPGRQGLDIEIFGMEGVPQEILDAHNREVTEKHFAEEAERARITGNPARGMFANGANPSSKRPRVHESIDDIAKRATKYKTDKKNGVLPAPAVQEPSQGPVSAPNYHDRFHSPFKRSLVGSFRTTWKWTWILQRTSMTATVDLFSY